MGLLVSKHNMNLCHDMLKDIECESLSRYVEGRVHKLCTYDVSMKECHEMVESGYLVFF